MPDQSLSLSQDQRPQMFLARQLLQSLEMLQLPVLELRTLVQNELQQNPTLEEKPVETESLDPPQEADRADSNKELNFKEEFAALLRMDDEGRNYFQQDGEYDSSGSRRDQRRNFFFDSLVQKESLQGHLAQQLTLLGLNEQDRLIAELIIGNINDDGYLLLPVEELAVSAGFDAAHVADILAMIQDMDPIGVGARDLKECLLIQLERLGQGSSPAAAIVRDHLDALARKHFKDIAHALKASLEDVHTATRLIATLEPKPGRMFNPETPAYIVPDVLVQKVNGDHRITLNNDQLPQLRISKQYRSILNDEKTAPDVRDYVKDKIRSSIFLMKSISQRQQTLYRVAQEIVRAQGEFLDHGVAHLKPLTMTTVAAKVGLHETTISRCLANKYIQTPQGLFEMKYFFTPGIKTSDGREMSNKTIKDMIASMADKEDPQHPISDQEMSERLKAQGIDVARRTVAKYRIALKLPPSHLRKSL